MKVAMWDIERIKPYPGNPRQNDAAIAPVAESIRQFGFRQPLVVLTDGVLVVGHTRWQAARRLGLRKVPVHVADLTEEQARAYRLADNRLAEIAGWDYDLLPIELEALQTGGVDLTSLGFDTTELAKLLEQDPADFEPTEEADQGRLDRKDPVRCPHCGKEFVVP
jgi:ParB-like chromosome segregation protein Spo0J